VFYVSICGAWSFVWEGLSPPTALRGDGTEQTGQNLNKLQIVLFFPTSFYE